MYLRIRNLCENHDLTQEEPAKILGMSQMGYSRYETRENDIPTDILISLAKYYNTTIDYILRLTNNKNPNFNNQK